MFYLQLLTDVQNSKDTLRFNVVNVDKPPQYKFWINMPELINYTTFHGISKNQGENGGRHLILEEVECSLQWNKA